MLKELSSHEIPKKLSLILFASLGGVELKLETDTAGSAPATYEGNKRNEASVQACAQVERDVRVMPHDLIYGLDGRIAEIKG